MPIPTFTGLGPEPNFQDVVKKINTVVKELQNLMLSLDTTNILEVDGDVLVSGTVTAGKINVNELSAISANLGHITAGLIEAVQIFGSYIATKNGAYPRAEMSNTNDLFGAWLNANNGILMQADYLGVPAQIFIQDGQLKARLSTLMGNLLLDAIDRFEINVTNGGDLVLPSFTRVVSSTGQSLGLALDDKAKAGISTNPSGGHNHGIPDGTQFKSVDGAVYTWRVVGDHTHEQTN